MFSVARFYPNVKLCAWVLVWHACRPACELCLWSLEAFRHEGDTSPGDVSPGVRYVRAQCCFQLTLASTQPRPQGLVSMPSELGREVSVSGVWALSPSLTVVLLSA